MVFPYFSDFLWNLEILTDEGKGRVHHRDTESTEENKREREREILHPELRFTPLGGSPKE
jgi:hypothetical protein